MSTIRHVSVWGDAMNNFYPRFRDLREDRDMTQEDVASCLGIKQPQYSRYERGYRDIPTDVLIRLAKLYGTSTDCILGLTNKSGAPTIDGRSFVKR